MTSQITFYLSQIIGLDYISENGTLLGRIRDFLIDPTPLPGQEHEPVRPRVVAIRVKSGKEEKVLDFSAFEIRKFKRKLRVVCLEVNRISADLYPNALWLAESIFGKQIVDINDRKLVRANDVRLVMIPSGTYAIAVDVGTEGVFRRYMLDKPLHSMLKIFRVDIPTKYILWDDLEAVTHSRGNIRLTKSFSKLNTLHPSDLADIIEDLDRATRTAVFASLDEERAADVLEELEPHAQIEIVESLPVEKVADVLEKMPADEVADLLDVLEDEKAEKLLREMDQESSEEVRELLEYSDKFVGSVMTTDFYSYIETATVEEILLDLRRQKPEPAHIYSILVTDKSERFLGAVPLGELVISDPAVRLVKLLKPNPVSVFDDDKVDSLAELVQRYNLLSVPVINRDRKMEGVVVVEDIVDDLLKRRKTR